MLVDCIGTNQTPWKILNEVNRIKEMLNQHQIHIQQCFREANQVDGKLATLSYDQVD